eukprot:882054-Prymnesium_polylepis.1
MQPRIMIVFSNCLRSLSIKSYEGGLVTVAPTRAAATGSVRFIDSETQRCRHKHAARVPHSITCA